MSSFQTSNIQAQGLRFFSVYFLRLPGSSGAMRHIRATQIQNVPNLNHEMRNSWMSSPRLSVPCSLTEPAWVSSVSPSLMNSALLSKRARLGRISPSAFDVCPGRGGSTAHQGHLLLLLSMLPWAELSLSSTPTRCCSSSSSIVAIQQNFPRPGSCGGSRALWGWCTWTLGTHGQVRVSKTAGLSGAMAPSSPETSALQAHS